MSDAKIIASKDIIKNEKVLVAIRIRRTATGILLYLQSKEFEDFFRYSGRLEEYGGCAFYAHPTKGRIPEYNIHQINGFLFTDGYPQNVNLSYLRAKGLTEGVTIPLQQVASTHAIGECLKTYKDAIVFLYNQYIKPIDISCEIIMRETRT